MQETLKELSPFIENGSRTDLKIAALNQILGIVGQEDLHKNQDLGANSIVTAILDTPEFLNHLILTLLDSAASAAKIAISILINMCASGRKTVKSLLNFAVQLPDGVEDDGVYPIKDNIVEICLDEILNPSSPIADRCCVLLSNMTHYEDNAERVVAIMTKEPGDEPPGDELFDIKKLLKKLLEIFTTEKFNKHDANFDYIACLVSNLSQIAQFRHVLLDPNENFLQSLLPYTTYEKSQTRRLSVANTLKNISFETAHHAWLLGDHVNILTYLLLPLAGNEEFDDEDNEKLPIDLQYLPDDKTREPLDEIRLSLLEALLQLSCKRDSRQIMRDQNVYVILREYHKWETNEKLSELLEQLVNIIIRTEEEIGVDNIKEINVTGIDRVESEKKPNQDEVKSEN